MSVEDGSGKEGSGSEFIEPRLPFWTSSLRRLGVLGFLICFAFVEGPRASTAGNRGSSTPHCAVFKWTDSKGDPQFAESLDKVPAQFRSAAGCFAP